MSLVYLSVDDTDSLDGMCTTYLAALLIEELSDFDLIGLPRLVRLNPNVPWKTRGNGAIALAFGHGRGRRLLIGNIRGRAVLAFTRGDTVSSEELLSRAKKIVERHAHLSCEKTNPGLVVSDVQPSSHLYWRAVREIIPLSEAEKAISAVGGKFEKYKNGRGIIGAAAAMAWRPRDRTFEILAYRQPERIGKPREIDRNSVDAMDREIKSTFHNIDRERGHIAIAPASPCPVLYGIRGDDPNVLLRASHKVISEPIDTWLIFLTNQGTDDHLSRRFISGLRARQGAILRGEVSRRAVDIPGGHVFFEIDDGSGSITCAVYEPSGSMRQAARSLIEGDMIEVYGSMREQPFELNIEKIRILSAASAQIKIENPICPACGRHMKSIGSNAGYRCRRCHVRASENAAKFATRKPPMVSWYEPPIASRRHLYKPVKRFGIERKNLREIIYRIPVVEADNIQGES